MQALLAFSLASLDVLHTARERCGVRYPRISGMLLVLRSLRYPRDEHSGARLHHTIRVLKPHQISDGFFVLVKLNEGMRSSATLTGVKHSQGGKDAERC